jgi:DNA (cytosine-5)-methyltransferase 1
MPFNISVIDLFAGPGGLGEGFSAYSPGRGFKPFSIKLSVEKEASAHKTLELRAFFRQFEGGAPDEYYSYLKGKMSREDLFSNFPKQSASAVEETL